eukprot:gene9623-10638_t
MLSQCIFFVFVLFGSAGPSLSLAFSVLPSVGIAMRRTGSRGVERTSPPFFPAAPASRGSRRTLSPCLATQTDTSYDIISASGALYDWVKGESLSSLMPLNDLLVIIEEARSNEVFVQKVKHDFDHLWTQATMLLDKENRSIREILGTSFVEKILKYVETTNFYEPTSVRAFLSTPVFETMLGGILYEGIFEFLQKVDIIGNIINKMPIIGAIRQAIMKEVKNSLDKTLGVQIKSFLSSFNKVAVQRMADFVLSPQNVQSFEKANVNLVNFLLTKKLKDLLPTHGDGNTRIKNFVWTLLLTVPIEDIRRVVTIVYDKVGEKSLSDALRLSFDDVITASPRGQVVLTKTLNRFLDSSYGQTFLRSLSRE